MCDQLAGFHVQHLLDVYFSGTESFTVQVSYAWVDDAVFMAGDEQMHRACDLFCNLVSDGTIVLARITM